MAETKIITSLYVITDSENSYDQIGDIDGGMFDETWLKNYIKNHDPMKLFERLAWMNNQICNMIREVNIENNNKNVAVNKM